MTLFFAQALEPNATLSSESEIECVGLVSFMGMQGKASLVAGVNAFKLSSQNEGCDGNGTTFSAGVSRPHDAFPHSRSAGILCGLHFAERVSRVAGEGT